MPRFFLLFSLALLGIFSLVVPALAHEESAPSADTSLPPQQSSQSSQIRESGRVVLLEATSSDRSHITLPLLVTPEGEQFVLRGDTDDLAVDQRIEVEGLLDESKTPFQTDGRILAEDITVKQDAEARPRASGTKGAMIAFVSWSGSGASGYGPYQDDLADLTAWSNTASDGAFQWDPVTRVNLVLPSALATCNPNANPSTDSSWTNTVKSKLTEMGYNLNNYRALGIALPQGFASSCVSTAYAYVGGNCVWGANYWCNLSVYSYDYSDYPTFIHEFGHTLLLPHANRAPCSENGSRTALTYSGTCTHQEYGDRYDPMGTSFSRSMYNPAFSDQLGWIGGGEIMSLADGSTTLTLKPYGGLSGLRAAKAALPVSSVIGGSSPGDVYLEYRANAGLDNILYSADANFPYVSCLAYTPSSNVFLRYVPSSSAADQLNIAPQKGLYGLLDESYLLDMTPATDTACDAGLVPGASWSDPTGKLRVSYLQRASDLSDATVKVEYNPEVPLDPTDPTDPTNPTDPADPSIPLDPLSVVIERGDRQITPSKNPRIFFALRSDRDLEAATVTADDFFVDNGKLLAVSERAGFYEIEVLGDRDGSVTLSSSSTFAVRDIFGVTASKAGSASVRLDRFVRRAQFILTPAKKSRQKTARFVWRANDEATFSCSLDGKPFQSCGLSRVYKKLNTGKHTLRVQSRDVAGNTSLTSYSWVILG